MTLTLRAVSLNEVPLTQPIKAHFDGRGGTIGRADHNTMALPDPERIISREQASITAVGTGYVIKNIGSANPIGVRNRLLERGESSPIAGRDQIRIGGYLLEVIEEPLETDGDATLIAGRRAVVAARTVSRGKSPLAPMGGSATGVDPVLGGADNGLNGFGPLSADNPFSDLLGDATPRPAAPAGTAISPAPSREPWSERLPTHFDPFAPKTTSPRMTTADMARPPGDSIADLLPATHEPSIDDLLGPRAGEGGDAVERFLNDAPRRGGSAAAVGTGSPQDFRETLRSLEPGAPSARALDAQRTTLPDQLHELESAFRPPRAMPTVGAAPKVPPPAAPAPAPVSAPVLPLPTRTRGPMGVAAMGPVPALPPEGTVAKPLQPATNADLWAAFCVGAGIELDPPQGLTPELMCTIGNLLRAAVDGTLRLTAFRAATRSEMGASVTVIKARENNPLKFSPDAQSALEQMLRPTRRAYLPPIEAMNAVMDDLLGHAIGTMAGTKAALTGVLARFSPDELEAKLAGSSVLDAMWRLNRKAKLWDLYLQHHEAIRDEAQDDFNALFGKAFLAAYEQQIEALQRERDAAAPG